MSSKYVDLTGMVFQERIQVLGFSHEEPFTPNSKSMARVWFCRCECGKEFKAKTGMLTSGRRSCSCLGTERKAKAYRLRKKSGRSATRTHRIWSGMRYRVKNKNEAIYKYYGGRGITVCDRWSSYENFLADMGECPEGLSLDRINVDGNYEPGNCRWATKDQQARNKRRNRFYTYNGKTMCLTDWVREITGNPAERSH